MKTLTLTIVIPVFNESRQIEACLKAIATQDEVADEVIVVNNNCTDNTVELAKKFSFVKVVDEKIQGRTAARNRGFDTATSDIIGRIDADSVVERDWVTRAKEVFQNPEIDAVTGPAYTFIFSETRGPKSTLYSRFYLLFANAFFRVPILWGTNMALRRSSWLKVRDRVCLNDKIVHEDQDISILLAVNGFKVIDDNTLLVSTNAGSFHYFPKLTEYFKRAWQTRRHRLRVSNMGYRSAYEYSFAYSAGVLLLLAIPLFLFYLSSFLYFVFSPIGKRLVKN